MAKEIQINKREAKSVLGAFTWSENYFPPDKAQESVKAKVYEQFPDLAPFPVTILDIQGTPHYSSPSIPLSALQKIRRNI